MLKSTQSVKAFCALPFQRLKVTSEGDATMCCFQTRKCLGNVLQNTFNEIWNGPEAQSIRKETLQNKLHQLCQVHSCPFNHLSTLKPVMETETYFYPKQLEIDLPTQHCNIGGENPTDKAPACLMCERHTSFKRQEDRLKDVCKVLHPYVRYLSALHVQGVAEPFWKDRIFEVFEDLGITEYKEQIRVSTTTNGTILTEKKIDRYLEMPISTITFSLDAATPETFRMIRRLNAYNKVCDHILEYSAKKTQNQWLNIHNNINLLNIKEVVGMVEFAAKAKVDLLDFNPTYCVPGICVAPDTVHLFKEAQLKILEAASDLGVRVSFMRDLTLDFIEDKPWDDLIHQIP